MDIEIFASLNEAIGEGYQSDGWDDGVFTVSKRCLAGAGYAMGIVLNPPKAEVTS